jgi:pimeloyl-ACP methyl ester carboxylesterase
LSVAEGLTPPLNYYRANILKRIASDPSKMKLNIEAQGLLIFGELEIYLVLDHVTVAQKYVKNLQGRIVKGANHFVQQDDPDTVNKYMREFLQNN